MVKYVLLSDNTLIYDYRNFPLLDFLPSAPSNTIPSSIYKFLRGKPMPATKTGELKYAPYALRKIEAALLGANKPGDVVVAHPDYLDRFVKDDTEVIGISTMDPFGLGPTTMSYYALFKTPEMNAWVKKEWEELIQKVNAARKGKKAKLLVGGPGVWEYTLLREEVERGNIDYLFQGEADDVAPLLFQQIAEDSIDKNMFIHGYSSFDETFHRYSKNDEKFLSRNGAAGLYPALDAIPNIVKPSVKSLNEIMRGCGIGCDFCEVTLRPLRYYPIEKIVEEIKVNIQLGGFDYAWIHTDEFFAYRHLQNYVPNEEVLKDLFRAIMAIPGVRRTNPTHGRISIPSAYPDLIRQLSEIGRAGPNNWIGIQVGLETGSERLAAMHMPAKTLPLRVGVDGSWQEIVWRGVYNLTKYFWRPAFTVQVGQTGETDEDNWDTVAIINRLSNSFVDGRPFEFTVTPLYNMPLGRIKAKTFTAELTPSMLAVYYAAYRHLAKMAMRDARKETKSRNLVVKAGVSSLISLGGLVMYKTIEHIAKKAGLDVEKVKSYGVGSNTHFESWQMVAKEN